MESKTIIDKNKILVSYNYMKLLALAIETLFEVSTWIVEVVDGVMSRVLLTPFNRKK